MITALFISGAVIACAVLIWMLVSARKPQPSSLDTIHLGKALATLVRASSSEEATQCVFALLREECRSERMAFLHKQRRFLQVESLFGLPESVRQDIRIQYQPSMVKACIESFEPREIGRVRELVTEKAWQAIEQCRFTHCLPVFWGEHVYGMLLVHFPESMSGEMSKLAAVAQALAGVHHLHWSRQAAERSLRSGDHRPMREDGAARPARQILKLVRHRNSETIVRKLVNTAQSEIGLERFICTFEAKDKKDELQLVAGGVDGAIVIPDHEQFDGLAACLSASRPTALSVVSAGPGPSAILAKSMADGGLSHALLFPLSPTRTGIFAWGDTKSAELIARRLNLFHAAAEDLLENAESFEKIEELSQTDSLTGLYNHRFFQLRLAEEVNRARRYQRTLGLVMIDLDMLKAINDVHGHQAGDAILRQVGTVLKSSVREIDIIARYGGDEFCVMMPEADISTCESFMARLRTQLASTEFQSPNTGQLLTCTISLGAAVFPDQAGDAQKLIFGADMALLKAKEQGRNTFVVFDPK